MGNIRKHVRLIRKSLIVSAVKLFFPSMWGVRLVKSLLLTKYLAQNVRSWRDVAAQAAWLTGTHSGPTRVVRYFAAKADYVIWCTLTYESWETAVAYHDFNAVQTLRDMAARGKGLLMLGLHYGPMFVGYTLHRLRLNPAILASSVNIPAPSALTEGRSVAGEIAFRASYDGVVEVQRFLKRFIEMVVSGRPGLILNDLYRRTNGLSTRCLGGSFSFSVLPFKLALKHAIPVAVVWLSKRRGRGYQLNVREMPFATVEEGVARYAALVDEVVMADPYPWAFLLDYEDQIRGHTVADGTP